LSNILKESKEYSDREARFIRMASVDFAVYNRFDKMPKLVIEVDGFAYHENDPEQKERDKLKDSLLMRNDIMVLRLKTNSLVEESSIICALNEVLR
jgi:very-short-patch-repair endonuclease